MIFALLFILAFLIGLVVFLISNKWVLAVAVPVILFCLNLLSDPNANVSFNLVFGLPLVAVAGLLGAYVVVIRRDAHLAAEELANEAAAQTETNQEAPEPPERE